MANVYDKGDLIRITGTFKDASLVAYDPTVVKCQVQTPAGVETTYTYPTDAAVVKDSTGNYHLDVSANASGTWWYRWYATGTGQCGGQGAGNCRQCGHGHEYGCDGEAVDY